MTSERDPVRLVDGGSEASGELRALLTAARQDLPSEQELSGLAARLGPVLGLAAGAGVLAGAGSSTGAGAAAGTASAAGTTTGTVGAAGVTAAKSATLLKLIGTVTAVAGVGAATVWGVTRGDDAPEVRPRPAVVAKPAPAPEAPRVDPAPPVVAQAPPESVEEEPAPSVAPRPRPQPALSEAELLQAAQSALRTNPRRALALVREHQRRFPRGALAQEREVIAIEALKRSGRAAEAGERAEDFKRANPNSAHRPRIDKAVERE